MGMLGDREGGPTVVKAPSDSAGESTVRDRILIPGGGPRPWEEETEELTLRDESTHGKRKFPESRRVVAAVAALVAVALGFGLPIAAGVIGDRRMQRSLDDEAAERAEAKAEADLAEARRQETIVKRFLIEQVANATTDEERAKAEQALADWRQNHPNE